MEKNHALVADERYGVVVDLASNAVQLVEITTKWNEQQVTVKELEDEEEVIMDDQDANIAELAEMDIQLAGMIAEWDGLQTQVEGLE